MFDGDKSESFQTRTAYTACLRRHQRIHFRYGVIMTKRVSIFFFFSFLLLSLGPFSLCFLIVLSRGASLHLVLWQLLVSSLWACCMVLIGYGKY